MCPLCIYLSSQDNCPWGQAVQEDKVLAYLSISVLWDIFSTFVPRPILLSLLLWSATLLDFHTVEELKYGWVLSTLYVHGWGTWKGVQAACTAPKDISGTCTTSAESMGVHHGYCKMESYSHRVTGLRGISRIIEPNPAHIQRLLLLTWLLHSMPLSVCANHKKKPCYSESYAEVTTESLLKIMSCCNGVVWKTYNAAKSPAEGSRINNPLKLFSQYKEDKSFKNKWKVIGKAMLQSNVRIALMA